MSDGRTISTGDVAKVSSQGGSVHVWNVLTSEYFSGEMIPGSRHVPLDRLEQHVSQARVPKSAKIVVYCSGAPSCPQSHMAAQKLAELGFTDVADYDGGLNAWKADGRQVERVDPATAAASVTR